MKPNRSRAYAALCSVLFAMLIYASPAAGQDAPSLYSAVDYMRANNASEYLEIEKTWKKLHQHLVNEGRMVWWGLYSVGAPSGSDQPYNYVTVRLYNDFADIENPFPDASIQAAFSDYSENQLNEMMNRTGASRDLVKSEYFVRLNNAQAENQEQGRYLLLGYMHAPEGSAGAYVNAENKYWKPIHEQRIAAGYITGWSLWARLFTGANDEYNFGTVNSFDEFGKIVEQGYTNEVIAKAHPGADEADIDRMMEETGAARSLVRQHLWVLIDSTMPAEQ